ncbi:MAG: (Fe-S)-binding protein [Candidatus Omnitrophica bacterium CG08_land_8_20_14_0_20_41_16]|uniref:(Fe-S)-binding protein n=1 Tax=Candidatus Sherwoodlollariibacterium unditelluris TaxID=1974757 RepID=A0A2G9YJU0_9BACT|nr:MAG: (Fe-S)-binding protein [Candidatus Omnitrophica bacterium CG23_combo_of_CG06-09_8_20_14_all_41_10]PIS33712.1 MAG: (Fe-S)-binding protein [Candidatus Omnitrophica bacterium CG08_land_8_20_14_0_20_41_16]
MVSKRIVLHFPHRLVNQPIVYKLVEEYDLQFNILKAFVTPEEEGLMVLELGGKRENFDKGVEYLQSCGVKIQPLSHDVVRNETKCTNCGVCVPICPTEAFVVDKKTRKVIFNDKKCIACELCIKICPPRAMEVHF